MKIEYYVLVCYEDVGGPLYWRIFIFAYFTVFQILGIMMAFQTRKVKLKGLKDSTFVTANVYISSIVIVVFILITFALRNYLNTYNTVFAIGTFILTTTFLVLTYIPKVGWQNICLHGCRSFAAVNVCARTHIIYGGMSGHLGTINFVLQGPAVSVIRRFHCRCIVTACLSPSLPPSTHFCTSVLLATPSNPS